VRRRLWYVITDGGCPGSGAWAGWALTCFISISVCYSLCANCTYKFINTINSCQPVWLLELSKWAIYGSNHSKHNDHIHPIFMAFSIVIIFMSAQLSLLFCSSISSANVSHFENSSLKQPSCLFWR